MDILDIIEQDDMSNNPFIAYKEAVTLFERSILELNKPDPDCWLLHLCLEKSISLITILCYTDQNDDRKEFLQEIFKTIVQVKNKVEGKLSNLSPASSQKEDTSPYVGCYFADQDSLDGVSGDRGLRPLNAGSSSIEPSHNEKQALARQQAIIATIVDRTLLLFDDVIGLSEAKACLKEAIIMPITYPHLFSGNRKPWTRILLYGPPGTGKSQLARSVASMIDCSFYSVSSSDLLSSWFGESEKMIRDLFKHATSAGNRSVVFMDEIDSLCRRRKEGEEEGTRRIKEIVFTKVKRPTHFNNVTGKRYRPLMTELLHQMDGTPYNDNVFLLCATNCPWEIDPAFLRRFQKRVYIPLPDVSSRVAMLKLFAGDECSLSEPEWTELGDLTDGFSGSDLSNLINSALFEPIRELNVTTRWHADVNNSFRPCVDDESCSIECAFSDLSASSVTTRKMRAEDLKKCLNTCKPTVRPADLELFENFTNQFGQRGT